MITALIFLVTYVGVYWIFRLRRQLLEARRRIRDLEEVIVDDESNQLLAFMDDKSRETGLRAQITLQGVQFSGPTFSSCIRAARQHFGHQQRLPEGVTIKHVQ